MTSTTEGSEEDLRRCFLTFVLHIHCYFTFFTCMYIHVYDTRIWCNSSNFPNKVFYKVSHLLGIMNADSFFGKQSAINNAPSELFFSFFLVSRCSND